MSSCSFASFLQFRSNNHHARDGHAVGTSEGPSSSFVAPPLMSPLDLSASGPSPSSNPFSPTGSNCSSSSLGSDSASPHKRHRAHSPDSRVPHHHYLDSNSYPSLASFSSEFGSSFPFSYPGGTITLPSVESVIASPQPTPLPVRSILCTSSSPTSSAVDTPLSSPPPTRPVSRRSSTSKSVRFARCTNASVFPTHSTEEYDRSPIVPTCEAQSLELKRSCSADGDRDEGGGWIKCVEREKVAAAAQQQLLSANGGGHHSSLLPQNAPNLENPVEGVHGLIEGGFFVGEERDQVANAPASVVVTGIPGVGVITEDIELEEEALELEDEMLVDDSAETVDDDDNDEEDVAVPDQDTPRRGSIQDDSASSSSSEEDIELPPSSVDSHQGGDPYGSNSSCASSSTSSIGHMTRGDSASPDMSATTVDEDSGGEDEQERERVVKEEREKVALKKKQRFGLCSLGKYTRQDVFGTYDSLGGF